MQKKNIKTKALALVIPIFSSWLVYGEAQVEKTPYPAMAPLDQYLIADQKTEITLARSAAPASISNGAEVMVLGRKGYTAVVRGSNGFVCVVERAWGMTTDDPQFWNPKVRGPALFQFTCRKHRSAVLSDEDETRAGGEIEV